jgi:hypothetical protein
MLLNEQLGDITHIFTDKTVRLCQCNYRRWFVYFQVLD